MAQLSITAPIFLVIALGYLAVRGGLISQGTVAGIGRFALYFAIPALIFRALSEAEINTILEPGFIIAYGGGCLATFLLMFALFRLGFGDGVTRSGLNAFGTALPNSIFVGFPVLLELFEGVPTAAFTMALLVENLLIFPLALVVMEYGAVKGGGLALGELLRTIFGRLFRNPVFLAILAGAAASEIDLPIPPVGDRVIDLLADAGPAAALFFIGGSLVGSRPGGQIGATVAVAMGKLLLNPLLVALIVLALPSFDPELQIATIVIAASPMLAIFPIVASKYGMEQESAAKLLVTTAASFVTISVILSWVI